MSGTGGGVSVTRKAATPHDRSGGGGVRITERRLHKLTNKQLCNLLRFLLYNLS